MSLLLYSKSLLGLNIVCESSIWLSDTQCVGKNVEVSNENDHLHFEFEEKSKDKSLNNVDSLEIHVKEKNAGFSVIPTEVFTIFPKLTVLWIMKSTMKELSSDNVRLAKKLEALGLRECKISEVKANTFTGFKNMKFLALESNKLTIINRNAFTGLTTLTTLRLTNNQIQTIEDGAFNLPQLIRLDLSRNKLRTLSASIFSTLPKVQSLYLSLNELTHIGRSLYSLKTIVNIGLDNNKIVDIDLVEFAKMPELFWLNLNNTDFSFKSQKSSGLKNTSFKRMILSNNNLENARDLNKLSIFKGLEVLDLSGNARIALELPSINIKSFLPKLEDVKLQRGNIDCEKSRMIQHKLSEQGVRLYYNDECKQARSTSCFFSFLC